MQIREARREDLTGLLALYAHLHENPMPQRTESLSALWEEILADKHHHILVGDLEGQIVSSCVLVVVPNLTRGQRPYALVENVVTHPDHRGKGCASQILSAARDLAAGERCYKIMLLTGSKEESILRFYERAGFNRRDKTGFIQWL